MLNIFEDQLYDDVVSRVEQSRVSYHSQTEEFHHLNTNLQTYLTDMKQIDDENQQIQNNIEYIRTDYIRTLENHLKRLPEDFRQQSQVLTEAHFERYKLKSRTKRLVNEREEIKKRINFLSNNEKDQTKRLNQLQKQERLVSTEFQNLTEQIQNLSKYVEREKQIHRQAMTKVDDLQIQLEQSSIERSKTEFEIQTLREEVQLMRTAKEFLEDEYQTILATQTDANEYFLLTLNESINRIREDFDELNKSQLKQIDNEYKQMIKVMQENSLTNITDDEATLNHARSRRNDSQTLHDEYQSITKELTTLKGHNHILSERALAMETDLYTLRDERTRELTTKDNELERSRMELQMLNEKLNYLSEYDRNLKFELTLYRGVLENEYRRKQQQSNNNQQSLRPTTRSNKNSSFVTNRNQLEAITEKTNVEPEETALTMNYLQDENIKNTDELDHQENFLRERDKNERNVDRLLKNTLPILMLTISEDEQSFSETESQFTSDETLLTTSALPPDLLSPLDDSQTAPKSPPSTPVEDLYDRRSSSENSLNSPSEEETSVIDKHAITSDVSQTPDVPSREQQTSIDVHKETPASPLTSLEVSPQAQETSTIAKEQSVSSQTPVSSPKQLEDQRQSSELLQSPSTQPENQDESFQVLQSTSEQSEDQHDSSELHLSSSLHLENQRTSSPLPQSSITSDQEVEQFSTNSSIDEQLPFYTERYSTSPSNTLPLADELFLSETQQPHPYRPQWASGASNDHSPITESRNVPSQENPSLLSDVRQNASTFPQEQQISPELEQISMRDENLPDQPSATTTIQCRPASLTGEINGEKNQLHTSSNTHGYVLKRNETFESPIDDVLQIDINDDRQSTSSNQVSDNQQQATNQSDKEENFSSLYLSKASPEEQMSSSDPNKIGYLSSSGYYGTSNNSTYLTNQESDQTSLTDVDDLVGEADISTSPKPEDKDFDDDSESNLEAVMQDLRCVYRDLANEEDLVEIDSDFSSNLVDRLEFGDSIIQTLFDGLLKKYIVEPAQSHDRSQTLDWSEFRDILFPILTGRYMERHIRKFFDLFDTTKDGYLSFQEITELLEILQVNNTTELAHYMINEFDKNNDGKLNVDEFIDAVKRSENINDNILSEKIEYKRWYIQHPLDDDENQSISLEVPIVNFSSKQNNNPLEFIHDSMILLGRIFKRVGADAESKQLDSTKPALSMKITNEFIHNNINISNNDLHLFIDLYLNKKQNSDCFIDWIEFRDVFRPFVNNGMFSKDVIALWLNILDTNNKKLMNEERVLLVLRLLQFSKPEHILYKLNEIAETYTNHDGSWTFEELLFAFEQIDETSPRLLSSNEQFTSFDREWLTKNIF